ncbi:MAG: hypothetical protein ACRCU5_15410 [Rhizobiaceae bacterium]
MPFDEIQTGTVVMYQYLWLRESTAGQSDGRKDRPVVVGIRLSRTKSDFVYFLPITTRPPHADTIAIEVPQIERRRAGLDVDRQQWIILSEYNADKVPGSWILEPDAKIGEFSKAFFQSVVKHWLANFKRSARIGRK